MFKKNIFCFSLGPLHIVLSAEIIEKSLAPSPLLPAISYLYTLIKCPKPFVLLMEQPHLPQPVLASQSPLWSFVDSLQCACIFLLCSWRAPACAAGWGCSSPSAGLCTSFC